MLASVDQWRQRASQSRGCVSVATARLPVGAALEARQGGAAATTARRARASGAISKEYLRQPPPPTLTFALAFALAITITTTLPSHPRLARSSGRRRE